MNDWSLKKNYLEYHYPFEKRGKDEFHALHEKVRFDLILSLAKITSRDVVLDAGCGTGFLSLEAAKRRAYIIGLDLSKPNLFKLMKKIKMNKITNLNVVLADIENLPFKQESFDLIICTETLEHIINTDNALSELRTVLRKAGRTIITVPNILWPWRWLFPLTKRDVIFMFHKPWKIFNYYLNKWKILLVGISTGYVNENKNDNLLVHFVFNIEYFKQLVSRHFKIQGFKTTFRGFYWTLPLIPITIQRKIATALTTNTKVLSKLGVQLLVLGKREQT